MSKLNEKIIDKLGGKTAVAEYLGVSKAAVYLWFYPKPKGNNGNIPPKQAIKLFELCQEKLIDCSLQDLLGE